MSRVPDPMAGQTEALRQALRQARFALALVALLLAAFVGAGVYVWLRGEYLVREKEKELLAATERSLETHSDMLLAAAGDVTADNLPILSEALSRQIRQDLPEYVRILDQEGDVLSKSLEARFRQKVASRYQAHLAGYRKVLHEEFPEETDPRELDRMMVVLQQSVERLADRYYVSEFSTQITDIKDLWKRVRPIEPGAGGEAALEDQLKQSIQEWLLAKFLEGGLRGPRLGFLPRGGGQ